MISGTVQWFSVDIGIGFIRPEVGIDVLVHESALARAGMKTLETGQKISFDILAQEGRHSATNLRDSHWQGLIAGAQ